MDKLGWLGVVLGGLGITLGAAVSAYLGLHPEAASAVLWVALALSGLLVVSGVVIVAWPRKKKNGDTGINVTMRDGNKIGRIGNDRV